jgi:putative hydrolase of the HAD superfamily
MVNRLHARQWHTVRVVLFDAVGTLLFPHPPVADAYHRFGRQYGSRLSRNDVMPRFAAALERHSGAGETDERRESQRWRSIVCDVFHDVHDAGERLFPDLWRHFASPSSWRLFDDVLPTWEELERRGTLLGIASNFDSRLSLLCRCLSPLDRAAGVFCSSAIGYSKPSREFFTRVQQLLGVEPDRILLVGDDQTADYDGALAAGWQAALLDRHGTSSDVASIKTLTELLRT